MSQSKDHPFKNALAVIEKARRRVRSAERKQEQDLHPDNHPEGVRSDLDPSRVLTYDGGKVIPREWFEDTPTQWATDLIESMTAEQKYADRLRSGLSGDLRIEAEIDMLEVERLLEP